MSNIVFILGAGASAEGGCPVMVDFFRRMEVLHSHGRLNELDEEFGAIERVRDLIKRGRLNAELNPDNLESVFSAIDMAAEFGRFGDLDQSDIERSRLALVRLIVAVLDRTQRMEIGRLSEIELVPHQGRVFAQPPNVTGEASAILGSKGYTHFAKLVEEFIADRHDVSLLSFNYDVGLEYSLFARSIPFYYPLDDRTESRGVPVFKLHGSMNWFVSRDTKTVQADLNIFDAIAKRACVVRDPAIEELGIGNDLLTGFCFDGLRYFKEHLGSRSIHPHPFIVPPTENKRDGRVSLAHLWRKAAGRLQAAQCVIVLGYSLPETDMFFRQFYALSVLSSQPLRHFWAYSKSGECFVRFQSLLGLPIRERFEGNQMPMTNAIHTIWQKYNALERCL